MPTPEEIKAAVDKGQLSGVLDLIKKAADEKEIQSALALLDPKTVINIFFELPLKDFAANSNTIHRYFTNSVKAGKIAVDDVVSLYYNKCIALGGDVLRSSTGVLEACLERCFELSPEGLKNFDTLLMSDPEQKTHLYAEKLKITKNLAMAFVKRGKGAVGIKLLTDAIKTPEIKEINVATEVLDYLIELTSGDPRASSAAVDLLTQKFESETPETELQRLSPPFVLRFFTIGPVREHLSKDIQIKILVYYIQHRGELTLSDQTNFNFIKYLESCQKAPGFDNILIRSLKGGFISHLIDKPYLYQHTDRQQVIPLILATAKFSSSSVFLTQLTVYFADQLRKDNPNVEAEIFNFVKKRQIDPTAISAFFSQSEAQLREQFSSLTPQLNTVKHLLQLAVELAHLELSELYEDLAEENIEDIDNLLKSFFSPPAQLSFSFESKYERVSTGTTTGSLEGPGQALPSLATHPVITWLMYKKKLLESLRPSFWDNPQVSENALPIFRALLDRENSAVRIKQLDEVQDLKLFTSSQLLELYQDKETRIMLHNEREHLQSLPLSSETQMSVVQHLINNKINRLHLDLRTEQLGDSEQKDKNIANLIRTLEVLTDLFKKDINPQAKMVELIRLRFQENSLLLLTGRMALKFYSIPEVKAKLGIADKENIVGLYRKEFPTLTSAEEHDAALELLQQSTVKAKTLIDLIIEQKKEGDFRIKAVDILKSSRLKPTPFEADESFFRKLISIPSQELALKEDRETFCHTIQGRLKDEGPPVNAIVEFCTKTLKNNLEMGLQFQLIQSCLTRYSVLNDENTRVFKAWVNDLWKSKNGTKIEQIVTKLLTGLPLDSNDLQVLLAAPPEQMKQTLEIYAKPPFAETHIELTKKLIDLCRAHQPEDFVTRFNEIKDLFTTDALIDLWTKHKDVINTVFLLEQIKNSSVATELSIKILKSPILLNIYGLDSVVSLIRNTEISTLLDPATKMSILRFYLENRQKNTLPLEPDIFKTALVAFFSQPFSTSSAMPGEVKHSPSLDSELKRPLAPSSAPYDPWQDPRLQHIAKNYHELLRHFDDSKAVPPNAPQWKLALRESVFDGFSKIFNEAKENVDIDKCHKLLKWAKYYFFKAKDGVPQLITTRTSALYQQLYAACILQMNKTIAAIEQDHFSDPILGLEQLLKDILAKCQAETAHLDLLKYGITSDPLPPISKWKETLDNENLLAGLLDKVKDKNFDHHLKEALLAVKGHAKEDLESFDRIFNQKLKPPPVGQSISQQGLS